MARGDIHGRAIVDPSNPRAFGVCEDCGVWENLINLRKQMEWYGNKLSWTGFFKCFRCLDLPQPQLRTPLIPPDPVPVKDPRPELGFAQAALVPLLDDQGRPLLDDNGNVIYADPS